MELHFGRKMEAGPHSLPANLSVWQAGHRPRL